MTLKEILLSLGAKFKDNIIGFPENCEILNSYPVRVTDDGMGYGVNEEFFVEASVFEDSDIIIFTEKTWTKEELEERRKEREEISKMLYDRRQLEINSK